MKVLIASKILVVAAYRRKLDAIASQPGVKELVVVTPPVWQEPGGRRLEFEPSNTPAGYELHIEPIRFNGNFHLFFWPGLAQVIRQVRPDLVHLDEEPYNLATAHGTFLANRFGARSLFFSWQNILRRYPPPFSLFERLVFRQSAHAIAGSAEALRVLRAKGYAGPGTVVPQFGVDPDLFSPAASPADEQPKIGFVSRLVEEKGIFVLLDALAGLHGDWRLHVIGSGPVEGFARRRAADLGIGARITWEQSVASECMPDRLRTFHVLVQPSLTRRHWKEQFGRVLVEAMACGVPVVGSDSGEIPNVVGDAGLIAPEGDPPAFMHALATLIDDPTLRIHLGQRGRERVLQRFTHARIAEQTVCVYRAAFDAPEYACHNPPT